MNTWEQYVKANDGKPPSHAFDLINYSRSVDSLETLSYNQGLSIYQKHTMQNRKKHKPGNKKKRKKKKSGKNSKSSITSIPISVTSPLLDPQNTQSLSPKSKKGKKISKKSKSSNNLMLDTPTRSAHSSSDDSNETEYSANDHVLLNKNREGIIRFIGLVHFTTGKLYGIELLNGSVGKHDGMIENERYFQSPPARGIFVRKKQIRRKMRNKDYITSSRLRRADSIGRKSINGSSIIKMIPAVDIKMVHGDVYDHSDLFATTHTMIINEKEPATQRGRSKKKQRSQHEHADRRSSSAKRAENRRRSTLKNAEKHKNILDKKRASKTIGDPDCFDKIKPKMWAITDDDDLDNSDWDDDNDDNAEDEIKRKRPQTIHIYENGSNTAYKLKRKRQQSVDDMIIDNYFGEQQSLNRVHSRIPDHRQRKNAATNVMCPASFKRFQQSKTYTNAIVSDQNSQKLQNRRSRDHLLHSHKKKKHQSVHIVSRKNNMYDEDIKLEQDMMKKPRRSSLDLGRKNKSKHVKGTQSVMDFSMIQTMQSEPVIVHNDKHSHSRFASVTNAIYKGWNFAKKKKKKSVSKKHKRNAIFGIDPLTLASTLIGGKDYECPIPNVLITFEEHLFENDGHLQEGIFRVAPNGNECKKIETELNDGGLGRIDFSVIDGVLIANLIKIFFRYLPSPILQMIDGKIEQIQNTHDLSEAEDIINNDINEPNKSYFKWLLDLCIEIIKYKDVNKMSCQNMAVVLAPNLFDPSKIQNPMRAMTISAATVAFLQVAIQWREQQESDDK